MLRLLREPDPRLPVQAPRFTLTPSIPMSRFLSGQALLALAALALVGCEADTMEDDASLSLLLDARVGTQTLVANAPNQAYTVNGRKMTLASARVYLSDIILLREDGTEVPVSMEPVTLPAKAEDGTDTQVTVDRRVVLARSDAGGTSYTLGDVPAGAYKGVRFNVGLAGLANRADATQAPATSPLATQTDKSNYWSWNSGYIFLRLDGKVDANGDGVADDADWNVHLGTSAMLTPVELLEPFDLEEGEMQDLHVMVDYARMLQGIDYGNAANFVCHTMNNLPVANAVKANLPAAFTLHGVHHHDH